MKQSYQIKSDSKKIRTITKKLNSKYSNNAFHIAQKQNAVCHA